MLFPLLEVAFFSTVLNPAAAFLSWVARAAPTLVPSCFSAQPRVLFMLMPHPIPSHWCKTLFTWHTTAPWHSEVHWIDEVSVCMLNDQINKWISGSVNDSPFKKGQLFTAAYGRKVELCIHTHMWKMKMIRSLYKDFIDYLYIQSINALGKTIKCPWRSQKE